MPATPKRHNSARATRQLFTVTDKSERERKRSERQRAFMPAPLTRAIIIQMPAPSSPAPSFTYRRIIASAPCQRSAAAKAQRSAALQQTLPEAARHRRHDEKRRRMLLHTVNVCMWQQNNEDVRCAAKMGIRHEGQGNIRFPPPMIIPSSTLIRCGAI